MLEPLLPENIVNKIPIEFAALLVSGYNIPIRQIVDEKDIDAFLDKHPHLVDSHESSFEKIS